MNFARAFSPRIRTKENSDRASCSPRLSDHTTSRYSRWSESAITSSTKGDTCCCCCCRVASPSALAACVASRFSAQSGCRRIISLLLRRSKQSSTLPLPFYSSMLQFNTTTSPPESKNLSIQLQRHSSCHIFILSIPLSFGCSLARSSAGFLSLHVSEACSGRTGNVKPRSK